MGAVKTARAVGANLQSGVVHAAVGLAGLAPRGRTPAGGRTGLATPLVTSISRRMSGMRSVAAGAQNGPVRQPEFVDRASRYQQDASTADEAGASAAGLWRTEGLAAAMGKHLLPENSLRDPALPREALPVLHVGFGSGSTESLVFDAAAIGVRFAERCAPHHVEFSYEGIGAVLRFYERGFLKLMGGVLDFIRLDAPDGPAPADFFADYLRQFPPGTQRLIAHGYGRIIAFSHPSLDAAMREATALPPERVEPVVHGVAFATAMINRADLPAILQQSAIPYEPGVRAAFQNGLVYAATFLDWFAPRTLATWRPTTPLERDLVDQARQEAALSQERGFPLAFRLANPRG